MTGPQESMSSPRAGSAERHLLPNYSREGFLERAAGLKATADRPISLQVMGVPSDAKVIASLEEAGFDRVVHGCPRPGRAASRPRWTYSRQP